MTNVFDSKLVLQSSVLQVKDGNIVKAEGFFHCFP